MRRLAALIVGAATGAAVAGTLTNGNGSFNMLDLVFSTGNGDGALITEPGLPDQLFKYCWYYRTPGNNQNRFFSSLDTPVVSFAGDTATITYTNAGPLSVGFERFNATFTIKFTDAAAPNTVDVKTTLVFTAAPTNTGNVTYQLFNLVDLDISGTVADDSASVTDNTAVRMRQTESSTANFGELLAVGATRYEVNTGSALRTKLNSGANNLSNQLSVSNADSAMAAQWTLTLAPGESRTISADFSINKPASVAPPCPADLNGDQQINLTDLSVLLANFGISGATAAQGDLNGDTQVNLTDLSILLSVFGTPCPQ